MYLLKFIMNIVPQKVKHLVKVNLDQTPNQYIEAGL